LDSIRRKSAVRIVRLRDLAVETLKAVSVVAVVGFQVCGVQRRQRHPQIKETIGLTAIYCDFESLRRKTTLRGAKLRFPGLQAVIRVPIAACTQDFHSQRVMTYSWRYRPQVRPARRSRARPGDLSAPSVRYYRHYNTFQQRMDRRNRYEMRYSERDRLERERIEYWRQLQLEFLVAIDGPIIDNDLVFSWLLNRWLPEPPV
jgi:hypothetical protein